MLVSLEDTPGVTAKEAPKVKMGDATTNHFIIDAFFWLTYKVYVIS